jgi:hypothetical protein
MHNPGGVIEVLTVDLMPRNYRREPPPFVPRTVPGCPGVHPCWRFKALAQRRHLPALQKKWEGFWAKTRKECLNKEGPDSKTMIDLRNMENGRPAPLLDQYENHCRIDGHATKDNVTTQTLSCFEFWDDYKSKSSS